MIVTERLYIRLPQDGDAKLLKRFEEKNKEHLRPWTTLGEFTQTPDEWNHRLVVWLEEYNYDKAIRFFIIHQRKQGHLNWHVQLHAYHSWPLASVLPWLQN